MGDLNLEEERELVLLGDELGIESDSDFEMLAAAIEVDFLQATAGPLPAGLAARLEKHAAVLTPPASGRIITPPVAAWRKIVGNPLTGWAAVAAIALVAFLGSQNAPEISPVQAEAKLRTEARDLIERKFAGLGTFKDAGVFDIPADGSPVVIPIAAKLALTNPQAFVITLE